MNISQIQKHFNYGNWPQTIEPIPGGGEVWSNIDE